MWSNQGLPCIPATSAKKKALDRDNDKLPPKGKGLRGGRGTVAVTAEW